MNTRLSQDALEVMQWHERQARHKQGYGPRPGTELTGRVIFPELTEQERQDREKQVTDGLIPF